MTEQDETESNTNCPQDNLQPECRGCLVKLNIQTGIYHIFEMWMHDLGEPDSIIADDLARLANIEISPTDRHSKVICKICYHKLQAACVFASYVRKNDYILQQRFAQALEYGDEWPQPIQVDKNINGCLFENSMLVDIKQEVLSEEEDKNIGIDEYREQNIPHLDIKIEPEELTEQGPIQIVVNGTISYDQINMDSPTDNVMTNGTESNEMGDVSMIAKSMMDQNNKLDDELIQKKKLANVYSKRHRKKKREEAQRQKLLSQNEPGYDVEQIQQYLLKQRRQLSKECSKRYRERKRLSTLKKNPNNDPALKMKDRRITIHNSKISGTSEHMKIPIVMNDYSVNLSDSMNNCAGSSPGTNNVIQANEPSCVPDEENCDINIDVNSPPLQVQAHASDIKFKVKEEPVSENEEPDPMSDLPLECMLCTKMFSQVSGLKAHVIAQHSYKTVKRKCGVDDPESPQKKQNKYVCVICRRRFSTSTDLMVHETCHNKHVCYGCNEKFGTFRQLSAHSKLCTAILNKSVQKPKTLEDVTRPQFSPMLEQSNEEVKKETDDTSLPSKELSSDNNINNKLDIHSFKSEPISEDSNNAVFEALGGLSGQEM